MKKPTLILLETIFLACIIAAAHFFKFKPAFLDLAVISLAASFAGRAIAYLEIFEWLRAPFTEVVPHSAGVGETVEPKENLPGWKRAIAGLVCCPVCAGTWSAMLLSIAYMVSDAGKLLAYILAASAVAWLVTYLTEAIEWQKHLAWENTGRMNKLNKTSWVHSLTSPEKVFSLPVWEDDGIGGATWHP